MIDIRTSEADITPSSPGTSRTGSRLAAVVVGSTLALTPILAATAASATTTPTTSDLAVEEVTDTGSVLVGAHVNLHNGKDQVESAADYEELIGTDLEIVNRFKNFSDTDMWFDRQHIEAGRQLMISWRATENTNEPDRARRIANGEFDREIRRMARAVRDLEAPVMIRFHWEMDQEPGQRQYIGTPAEYRRAWQRVHRIFGNQGADNVSWVFAPRALAFKKGTAQPFYPGDEYVDWIGGSAVPFRSFRAPDVIFDSMIRWADERGKETLVWVGVREEPGNPDFKPEFIDRFRERLSTDWSSVDAFLWYHAKEPFFGYEYWADTSDESLAALQRLVTEID